MSFWEGGCPSVVLRLWHKRRLICCRCFPRRGGKEGDTHFFWRNRPCDINLRVAESSFSDVLDVQCFVYVEWHMFYVYGFKSKKPGQKQKWCHCYEMLHWLFNAGIHLHCTLFLVSSAFLTPQNWNPGVAGSTAKFGYLKKGRILFA